MGQETKRRLARSDVEQSKSNVPTMFIAPLAESSISAIALTKAHFLDTYSKGKWNISKVPCPPCFDNVGYLEAPECYNEASRQKVVKQYMDKPHWQEKGVFKRLVSSIKKNFRVSGVSISLLDRTKAYIKVDTLMDLSDIPRHVSIDAHAILSQGYFLLLDASKDWRTAQNPFVAGAPHIKFYCAVPLMAAKNVIGVLSIFDSSPALEFSKEKCKMLYIFAREVVDTLNSPLAEVMARFRKNESFDTSHNAELDDLRSKLGRATSTKSDLRLVFEKDASGGPYSQNHRFRFSRVSSHTDPPIDPNALRERCYKLGSFKSSAMMLTKMIAEAFELDFVYILEIRIAEPCTIARAYFPSNESKVNAAEFKYANKVTKNPLYDNEFMTRIIGIHGSKHVSLNFENSIHYHAYTSEFGIRYRNPKQTSLYNSGFIMPIYRHNTKYVNKSTDKRAKILDIYLRSGGYLIAGFNRSAVAAHSQETISQIFENTSVLRKVYIN